MVFRWATGGSVILDMWVFCGLRYTVGIFVAYSCLGSWLSGPGCSLAEKRLHVIDVYNEMILSFDRRSR